jgi:hypothetical protein
VLCIGLLPKAVVTTTIVVTTRTTQAVGGFMEPTNKLSVLAPYLALFGIVGAIAVIVWKKPRSD